MSHTVIVSGFNAFGQWPKQDPIINGFKPAHTEKDYKVLYIGWSYNIVSIHDKAYISGAWSDKCDQLVELKLPSDLINFKHLDVTGTDEYLLLLDKLNQNIWKCAISDDSTQEWKKITQFWNVEDFSPSDAAEGDKLVKIIAGSVMNLCMTSGGNVYQIPQKINVNHCAGKVVDIDCGHEHAIILTDRGNVYTWGSARRCQLGHGDLKNLEEPELVEALGGINIIKVKAGGWHSCALSDSGDLYVWGWNVEGQLGLAQLISNGENCSSHDGPSESKKFKIESSSTAVPTLLDIFEYDGSENPLDCNVVDVDCGSKHTAIVLSDNSVWTAGLNTYGQLGTDTEHVKKSNYFRKVYQNKKKCSVRCGPWSTVLLVFH